MRLQLTVIRNTLAPIRNVFNTRSKEFTHHPITTVADLLAAVDSFIQLESEDWGFEDYVVETRLNDEQDQAYEAFHWQELKDVFQEDDEVTIRPLSEKELKVRRQGGRHQVCRDGVHLIDGGAWGKGLMVAKRRPKINIPPRRTLRAIEQADQLAQIEYGLGDVLEPELHIDNGIVQALVPFLGEEEDSEDDEDDEDFDAAQDGLEDEDEDDDSDFEHDGEEAEDNLSRQRKVSFTLPGNELEELVGNELNSVSASRKRKRTVREQPPRQKRRLDPSVTSSVSESSLQINGVDAGIRTAIQRVPAVLHANETSSEDSESESDTEVNSDSEVDDQTIHQGPNPASTNDNPDYTSSSGSDSDSDDTSSSDDTASESDSVSDSGESSSSSEDTASPAESETKDVDSTTRGAKSTQPKSTNGHESGSQSRTGSHTSGPPTRKDQEAILDTLTLPSKPNVPPGQGMSKTKRNNVRKRLGKIMKKLKDEDKLPKEANLDDVRRYLQEHEPNGAEGSYNEKPIAQMDELSARKEAAYAKLNATSLSPPHDDNPADGTPGHESPIVVLETVVTDGPTELSNDTSVVTAEEDRIPMQIAQTTPASNSMDQEAISEPSPKRTRLDVASSRRMLFTALGVRTPKTPEAEQALRDKLAKPTRQVKARETVIVPQEPINTPSDPERWRLRLTIKAVECKNVGKQIETPPFPFKHPWEVRKEKEQRRHQRRGSDYQWYENEVLEEEDVDNTQDVTMGQDEIPSQTLTTSRTLTAGMEDDDLDDLPIPSDFDVLFDLSPSDLVEGTVIAYKELHLNQSFQPEQSSYRVARILDNKSKQLKLRLAPQYRDSPNIEYDEETGERIYNKFDMPVDEDEIPDDGVRQLAFDELIQPKFVSPSDSAEIVIAQSQSQAAANESQRNGTKDGHASKLSEMVPNSAPAQSVISGTDVSSSRRDEINGIIKEAGFESALDEQLLEPLVEHTEGQPEPSEEAKASERQDDMQLGEWHSSPVAPSSPFKELEVLSGMRESSVPSESMVESVRYPNLSQLGLDTPSVRVHSSSHQDAQRLTPTPMVDNSGILHTELEEEHSIQMRGGTQDTTQSGVETNSLGSEVPQTDSLEVDSEANTPAAQIQQTGFDGSYSPSQGSDDESDDESVDSVGLPSLRSLTSSQVRKIKGELPGASNNKMTKKGEGSRRSPRISKKTAALNRSNASELESPPRSIKASQSQKPKLSQIPEDTIVVDLTQSSPAGSPPKTSQGRSNRRAASSSQQASAFKRSFQGLGEKSFLKRKKTSL